MRAYTRDKTHYSQIQWVEEEDQVFALEVIQAHLLEFSIVDGCAFKGRGRMGNRRSKSGCA